MGTFDHSKIKNIFSYKNVMKSIQIRALRALQDICNEGLAIYLSTKIHKAEIYV